MATTTTEMATKGLPKKKSFFKRLGTLQGKKMLMAYAVVLPTAAVYCLFFLYPVLRAFYLSFTSYRMMSADKGAFVGLDNYIRLFHDEKAFIALKHSFQYTLMAVPTVVILGLLLALLVNQLVFARGLFRAIYFAPVMTAGVAVVIIFRTLLHPSLGFANQFLGALGLPPYQWYMNPGNGMPTLVLISTWESVGYQMILILAGLQNIPGHFYDAAKVDGAGAWQRFRYITLPLLRPTLMFVFITAVIGSFQIFTSAFMFGSAPKNGMSVALLYIYRWGITEGYLGLASAAAVILFGIIMIFTLIQLRLMRTQWEY